MISGNQCVKKLQKLGFVAIRQKGSHVILRHDDGRITVVPCHQGKDLDRRLLYKILRDAEITPEQFNEM